jgi:hypothetical protein
MGLFSWKTQDTDESIPASGSTRESFTVYMSDGKTTWKEDNYEGYGEFGGKDYYELLDEMNGGSGDRGAGIDLAFNEKRDDVKFPSLTRNGHFYNEEPQQCEYQGWFYGDEDENEDY